MGKTRWPALALGAAVFVARAQSGTPPAQAPVPPPAASNPSSPGQQTQQRGFIAPIVDIRIQDQGISLPQPKSEPEPAPAKPPAK